MSKKREEEKQNPENAIQKVKDRIDYTFFSILFINWILIAMGVVAFFLATFEAAGGNFETAGLLTVLGAGDIIGVFKFAMDRVQRNLGDQSQVEAAFTGLADQRRKMNEYKHENSIEKIKALNREIERSTLYTMKLIQGFTEIAKPPEEKPWLRRLPIKFGTLTIKSGSKNTFDEPVVMEGESIEISGSIENTGEESVTITMVVIAIRPPLGTPDGGPFRFDFYVDKEIKTIGPNDPPIKITHKKRIEQSFKDKNETLNEKIEQYGRDWYAFLACQTTDGCWHDDHNKVSFELKKSDKKQSPTTE